jgi:hypothetical protein
MQMSFSGLRPIVTGRCCGKSMDSLLPLTSNKRRKAPCDDSGTETPAIGRAMDTSNLKGLFLATGEAHGI